MDSMRSNQGDNYYLEQRINSLAGQVANLESTLAETQSNAMESRMVLARLVARLAAHNLLTDEDRGWLSSYLGPTMKSGSLQQATARVAHRVIGKIKCACGAVVDDIEGDTDEQCPWCGAIVHTAR